MKRVLFQPSLIFFIAAALPTLAVSQHQLTEADCLKLALQKHPDIIQAERNLLTAQYRYQNQQLQWQPTIKPLQQETVLAEEKLTFNATTGLEWQTQSGANIHLQSSLYYDYDRALSNIFDFDDEKNYLVNTVISAKYPLLGADKLSAPITVLSNYYGYQAAIQQYKTSIQNTLLAVAQNYRQILMLEEQLSITQELFKQATNRHQALVKEVQAGKKAKNLIPESEVQLMQFELDIMQAQNTLRKATLSLQVNLGIDKSTTINLVRTSFDKLEAPKPVQDILMQALQENQALINLKNQITLQEKTNKQEKSRQSLQANASAQVLLGSEPRAQGNLQLSYPLDNRTFNLQTLTQSTSLALQKSQFLQQCQDAAESLEDLYRDLLYEKKSLELQKKKLSLEEQNYQHLLLQHKMGLIAAITLNEKLNTLNNNTIQIASKTVNYHNKLDNYAIQCSTYLKKKEHLLSQQMLTNLAKTHTPFATLPPPTSNTKSLCQTLLNQ